jgi:predicted nucleic acid-binding protein
MRSPGRPDARAVFIDTFALVALANQTDSFHDRAKEVMVTLAAGRVRLLTTEWVLTETLATCSPRPLRRTGTQMVRSLLESPSTTIVHANHRDWLAAFDLYESRPDKEWSLVDCASMLVCRSRGVTRIFTHDHHFTQAGCEVLLP